jgi:succinate dehydrogenase hydrophobic anchor subunit
MSFGIYLIGYVIFIAGAAYGAWLLKVPEQWIGVGVACLIGLAIAHGAVATRRKDPPA